MRLLLTSLTLIWMAVAALAHEIRPAVGDLSVREDRLTLSLRLNGEVLVAGIRLEGLENTDDSLRGDIVDALRVLPPEELVTRLQERLPELIEAVDLRADGTPLTVEVAEVRSDPVGDFSLPRDSVITLIAPLAPDALTVSLEWPAQYGTLILRQQGVEDPYTGYLSGQGSGPIPLDGQGERTVWGSFVSYISVGFDHILPKGLDHILFVLGLFFFSPRFGPLIWQVSAFTLAHTVTLALGALGIVVVPGHIVEPIIAASIVFVAVENLFSNRLSPWRPLVIFGFGLLHGLGFAAVLGEFGLPRGQFIPALLGFNVGVEIGQLTVIAGAFALVIGAYRCDGKTGPNALAIGVYGVLSALFAGLSMGLAGPELVNWLEVPAPIIFVPMLALSLLCLASVWAPTRDGAFRRWVAQPASAGIALVGVYWVIERVFGL